MLTFLQEKLAFGKERLREKGREARQCIKSATNAGSTYAGFSTHIYIDRQTDR